MSVCWWDTDAADGAAGAGDADGGLHRRAVADALQHRVDALAAGEFVDALDRVLAALGDDVGGAVLAGERDAVGVAAHDDDLLGAEALGGDHRARADGAVADDRGALARRDLGDDRGVMPGAQDVGEREQRRHERVVLADRQRVQGPVSERDAQGLCLGAVGPVAAEEADVDAGGRQALVAERAGAVGKRERHHDEVAPDRADLRADVLDDADGFVAHAVSGLRALHRGVGPEVAAADAGAGDADDRVGRFDDLRVGDVLGADVAGT
jgi:hypothetical protein